MNQVFSDENMRALRSRWRTCGRPATHLPGTLRDAQNLVADARRASQEIEGAAAELRVIAAGSAPDIQTALSRVRQVTENLAADDRATGSLRRRQSAGSGAFHQRKSARARTSAERKPGRGTRLPRSVAQPETGSLAADLPAHRPGRGGAAMSGAARATGWRCWPPGRRPAALCGLRLAVEEQGPALRRLPAVRRPPPCPRPGDRAPDLKVRMPMVRAGLNTDRIAALYPDRRLDFYEAPAGAAPLDEVVGDLALQSLRAGPIFAASATMPPPLARILAADRGGRFPGRVPSGAAAPGARAASRLGGRFRGCTCSVASRPRSAGPRRRTASAPSSTPTTGRRALRSRGWCQEGVRRSIAPSPP